MYQKIIIFSSLFLTFFASCFSSNPSNHSDDPLKSSNVYYKTSHHHPHGHLTHHNRHGNAVRSFDVDNFGAKANGSDDSKAFLKAWKSACSSTGKVTIYVPKNREYILKSVKFSGPCKSSMIVFKVYGTIKAWNTISDYKDRNNWIVFENVDNLRVDGGGLIDGNGHVWWQQSCKINHKLECRHAPTAITFVDCSNLRVSNIRVENAQQMHMRIQNCDNVKASHLTVISPEHSPNTDGIHITGTRNILIEDSVVSTGDDCISIVSGSENVRATGITCGPGHGISIGSLGKDKTSEEYVSNVLVKKSTLIGTTNGVRIKTWQGGHGIATNIIFEDIIMQNVTNPILIDQNYCDHAGSCPQQRSAVEVSNVLYRNIQGTSNRPLAVKFDCSRSIPCRGISMQNVQLVDQTQRDRSIASCSNVKLDTRGTVSPLCFSS